MSEPAADEPSRPAVGVPFSDTEDSPATGADMPAYKGAPLDAERGPGLGCFWIQVVLLVALLIATPLSVVMVAPPWLSALLLFAVLALLFFVGQTMIFLLRLVAADRRAQRRPLREGARKTVGQLESEADAANGSLADADVDDASPADDPADASPASDQDDTTPDKS